MKKQKEEVWVLTEQACMQEALKDFGIDVSIPMAKAILNDFMDMMVRMGHIEKVSPQQNEEEDGE